MESLKLNKRLLNIHYDDPEETIVLGTPNEYEDWLKND